MLQSNFSKCARCKRPYVRVRSAVCTECMPAEEADYDKISNVLARTRGLTVEQVSEEAGVTVHCVLRMLDDGLIQPDGFTDDVKCGQCGAPAISPSKKLCKSCLTDLDRKCVKAMDELRKKYVPKATDEGPQKVRQIVDKKRSKVQKDRRGGGNRMVYQERHDKDSKKMK